MVERNQFVEKYLQMSSPRGQSVRTRGEDYLNDSKLGDRDGKIPWVSQIMAPSQRTSQRACKAIRVEILNFILSALGSDGIRFMLLSLTV